MVRVVNGFVAWTTLLPMVLPCAQTQLSPVQLRAFRGAKMAVISVTESYEDSVRPHLPFEEVAQHLLRHAGLSVLESGTVPPSGALVVKITATAVPLQTEYSYSPSGPGVLRSAGAKVSGTILLQLMGADAHETPFEGSVGPPFFVRDFHETLFSSYREAFHAFVSAGCDVVAQVYGNTAVVRALAQWIDRGPPSDCDSCWEVAAKGLQHKSNNAELTSLVSLLKRNQEKARVRAATALGLIGNPISVPALIWTLKSDEAPSVRAKAAEALAQVTGPLLPLSVPALGSALKQDRDPSVRASAARALGETASPSSVQYLISALADGVGFVRGEAAKALGRVRDPRSIEPLIVALKAENSLSVRNDLAYALREITWESYWDDVDAWSKWLENQRNQPRKQQ